jgi:hypothetical protein
MMRTALGVPMPSKIWNRVREAVFANRPTSYVCVVMVVAVVSCLYQLRIDTIFSCQAGGYSTDRYLAYCHGPNYADYEHGAFYFELEPTVRDYIRNADVLFLGNSRLQVALSTPATADWFSAASARYYLLGFSYFENEVFAEELLRRIRPRARVYVINVDQFFDRSESPPVKTILHDPAALRRYEVKRLWQRAHEPICKSFAALCGTKFVVFRSRETGAYYTQGAAELKMTPVSYDQTIDQQAVSRNTATATDFLLRFAEGKCVILTTVPFAGTRIGDANAIATGLGMKLVTPGIVEGLHTYDGYHLDQPSAQRWSQAFFKAAGSKLQSCLEKEGAPSTASSTSEPVVQ